MNQQSRIVLIRYTNYRGETADRRIVPVEGTLRFAEVKWHPGAQWVFDAIDVDRADTRTFAMKDVHSWRPEGAAIP